MRREAGSGAFEGLTSLVWTAARFAVVGVANTAVGFGVIMILEFVFHLSPELANAGGYAVGFVVSFILNRRFTFNDRGRAGPAAARFVVAALASFAVNQAVLHLAIPRLGRVGFGPVLSQGLAAASYTVSLFILCKLWVFRSAASPRQPHSDEQHV